MPGRRITIEVPSETADAYQKATPERRRRAERALSFALLSRAETIAAFEEITGRMASYAERQGLTPEKLDELLDKEDA